MTIQSLFFDISRELNNIGITPILYGSLGLQKYIRLSEPPRDIDIIISKNEINKDLVKVMEKLGLRSLNNFHFIGSFEVAFLTLEDMYVPITENNIVSSEIDGVKYFELPATYYFESYKKYLAKNPEREKQKGDSDRQKISALNDYIENISKKNL